MNQDRYIEFFLGVAWAGAVIVPLNIRWSAPENEDALLDCRPKVLFVDAAFAAMGREIAERSARCRSFTPTTLRPPARRALPDYEGLLAAAAPVADAEAGDDELAGIFYTGGTTGRSKGVMLSHRNLMANVRNMLAEGLVGENTVFLDPAPMFHLANAADMYAHFLAGSRRRSCARSLRKGSLRRSSVSRVTDILLVPTLIQMFVDDPSTSRYDLSSLRLIIYGASPISEALLERAIEKLPTTKFVQAYGMTELSPFATLLPWKDHIGEGRARGRHRSGGRPMTMVDVRIVGASDNRFPRGSSAKSSRAAKP